MTVLSSLVLMLATMSLLHRVLAVSDELDEMV